MEYMPLVWLGIIILAVIVEASTCALVSYGSYRRR